MGASHPNPSGKCLGDLVRLAQDWLGLELGVGARRPTPPDVLVRLTSLDPPALDLATLAPPPAGSLLMRGIASSSAVLAPAIWLEEGNDSSPLPSTSSVLVV